MHVNLQHTLFSSGSHDGRGVNKLCCDCFIYRLITVQATGKNDMPEILMRNLTQTHTLQYICHVVCAHAVMLFPSQNSPEDLYLINKLKKVSREMRYFKCSLCSVSTSLLLRISSALVSTKLRQVWLRRGALYISE